MFGSSIRAYFRACPLIIRLLICIYVFIKKHKSGRPATFLLTAVIKLPYRPHKDLIRKWLVKYNLVSIQSVSCSYPSCYLLELLLSHCAPGASSTRSLWPDGIGTASLQCCLSFPSKTEAGWRWNCPSSIRSAFKEHSKMSTESLLGCRFVCKHYYSLAYLKKRKYQ